MSTPFQLSCSLNSQHPPQYVIGTLYSPQYNHLSGVWPTAQMDFYVALGGWGMGLGEGVESKACSVCRGLGFRAHTKPKPLTLNSLTLNPKTLLMLLNLGVQLRGSESLRVPLLEIASCQPGSCTVEGLIASPVEWLHGSFPK